LGDRQTVSSNIVTVPSSYISNTDIRIIGQNCSDCSDRNQFFSPTSPDVSIPEDVVYDRKICTEDAWKETGRSESLVCRAKNVHISHVSSSRRSTCIEGQKFIVDLQSTIHVASGLSDLAWYIASDGGDALVGTCSVHYLQESAEYIISGGKIGWNNETDDTPDVCGDVQETDEDGVDIEGYLGRQFELMCSDINKDGYLDFSLCFTWQSIESNSKCDLAAFAPGTVSECDCNTYDVPEITVTKNDTHSSCL
jgi:hypothetical protein